MKCEEVRENLAAYLDDEIEGASRRAVDDHLAGCPACAAECDAQHAAWALLDRFPPVPAPAGFDGRVLARARSDVRSGGHGGGTAPRGRILRMPVPLAAAAAALLAAVGGAWWARGHGTAGDPPTEMLADLAVLESWEALHDGDVEALVQVSDIEDEDLVVLGGGM